MRRTPLTRSKPMRKVSKKRKEHRASDEGRAGLAYMGKVKQLPCCVCGAPPPSIAHHCFHDRYGNRKENDMHTIPLCAPHHDYPHPEAIHSGKETWRAKFGADHDYIEETRKAISTRED